MARQILPIIGAAVGSYLGGPTGAQIGWMVGSYLGNAVDPQVQKAPNIGDLSQQTSQEGNPRPVVFGTSPPMAGNLIACSQPKVVKRRKRQGKGGPVIETNSIYRTYAVGICEGPAGIVRVWKNGTLVYDIRPGVTGMDKQNTEFLKTARLYDGNFTQLPSPDLEAFLGVGNTPAFRGTCYMVQANEDLTDSAGAISAWAFQVNTCWQSPQQPALLGGTSSGLSPSFTIDGVIWQNALSGAHPSHWISYYSGTFISAIRNNDLLSVYRSHNGSNWDRITPPDTNLYASAFNDSGRLVLTGGIGGTSPGPIFYSDDYGDSWQTATVTPSTTFRKWCARYLNGLYLSGDQFGGIYNSADGQFWNYENAAAFDVSDFAYGHLGYMAVCGLRIAASSGGSRITYTGAPGSWTQQGTTAPGHIKQLAYFAGKYLGICYDGGLYSFNDGTAEWELVSGQPIQLQGSLGVFQGRLYVSAIGYVARTSDLINWDNFGETDQAPFDFLCAGEVPIP